MKLKPETKAAIARLKNVHNFPHVTGATLNRDGSLFRGRHGDIVTIASRNVSASRLSPALIERFARQHPKAKIGLFRLQKKKGFISLDANIVRSSKLRPENIHLARQHRQEAIFDLTNKKVVIV